MGRIKWVKLFAYPIAILILAVITFWPALVILMVLNLLNYDKLSTSITAIIVELIWLLYLWKIDN